VAELIWKRIKPEQPFSYMSMPAFKYDVQKRIPNVEKARNLLGVSCDTPIEVVLDELIPWIKMAIDKNWI
jgi:nucleoside-diphosphate-sugar epimerase